MLEPVLGREGSSDNFRRGHLRLISENQVVKLQQLHQGEIASLIDLSICDQWNSNSLRCESNGNKAGYTRMGCLGTMLHVTTLVYHATDSRGEQTHKHCLKDYVYWRIHWRLLRFNELNRSNDQSSTPKNDIVADEKSVSDLRESNNCLFHRYRPQHVAECSEPEQERLQIRIPQF